MSLGPTPSTRNSDTLRTRSESLRETDVKTGAAATPTARPAATDVAIPEHQRVPVSPDIQSQSRAATAGSEEALRQKILTNPADTGGASQVRRGLTEGWDEAGKRSGSGRRTAEAQSAPGNVQVASLSPDGAVSSSRGIPTTPDTHEAGKRSGSGRRKAEAETEPSHGGEAASLRPDAVVRAQEEAAPAVGLDGNAIPEDLLLAGKRSGSGRRTADLGGGGNDNIA